jgi:hypothetical protein
MLYHTLARHSALWSFGGESNAILEGPLHPSRRGWGSNALGAADLAPGASEALRRALEGPLLPGRVWRYRDARRAAGDGGGPGAAARLVYALDRWTAPARRRLGVVFLEKSPRNCLRVPFLDALFPDARFVLLRRDGRATISSLMDGWRAPGKYETYALPEPLRVAGYGGGKWCFVLPPGWRDLVARPLEEVCARQWEACAAALLRDLPPLRERGRVFDLAYEDLAARPREVLGPLLAFLGLPWEEHLLPEGDRIPVVNATSPPEPDKWRRRNGEAIDRVLPLVAATQRAFGYPA